MSSTHQLSESEIKNTAILISLEALQSEGITRQKPIYRNIEKVIKEALNNGLYAAPILWPDGTYSVFICDAPILLDDLSIGHLTGAYYQGYSANNYCFDLR